ncbi:hypothetical protein MBAV_003834 [Candidatus Magnetobacterium bavaricum]|uniref:Uncharacterized protein n=1 Tax=Candidatus Magnetobacterium bavaricum TaxID=29290 RepID=A0A0F3GQ80_9BACT|nr:hypothetical protein MBAV_003834 [Candidatus Magnetobacterium bavaricum]
MKAAPPSFLNNHRPLYYCLYAYHKVFLRKIYCLILSSISSRCLLKQEKMLSSLYSMVSHSLRQGRSRGEQSSPLCFFLPVKFDSPALFTILLHFW